MVSTASTNQSHKPAFARYGLGPRGRFPPGLLT
jgi:hypothetical protein